MQTAQLAFVGRKHLVERARRAVDAGQHVHLVGEHGIGKTTLARRLRPGALYLGTVSPVKELITALLAQCYRLGWFHIGDAGDELDDAQLDKRIRRITVADGRRQAVAALSGRQAVIVLDDFDRAGASVLGVARELARVATLVVCSVAPPSAQLPFLGLGFERIEVGRLAKAEAEELADRLLAEHRAGLSAREAQALKRHVLEQAQGVPAILQELVGRARRRGEVSLRAVRNEPLSAHKTIDMTPALLIAGCFLLVLRIALRGVGDQDLTIFLGAMGGLFMVARLFGGALSGRRRRG